MPVDAKARLAIITEFGMGTSDKKFAPAYTYDALDRLTTTSTAQRFYNSTRIATEIEGTVKRSFFEYDTQPLAQQQAGTTTLLATDEQTSVLHSVSTAQSAPHAYSPYGHRPVANGLLSVLGFNGERPDPLSGYYLLGQGYRAFNPVLMRFNSPDSFSPFGEGGINAYAYCGGDPVNRVDPTGHIHKLWKVIINKFERSPSTLTTANKIAKRLPEVRTPQRRLNPPPLDADTATAEYFSKATRTDLFSDFGQLSRETLNDDLSHMLDDLYVIKKLLASDQSKPSIEPHVKANLIANKGLLEKHTQKTIERLPLHSYESLTDTNYLPSYDEGLSIELMDIRKNLLRKQT